MLDLTALSDPAETVTALMRRKPVARESLLRRFALRFGGE
jgi:hypothetical protein